MSPESAVGGRFAILIEPKMDLMAGATVVKQRYEREGPNDGTARTIPAELINTTSPEHEHHGHLRSAQTQWCCCSG